MNWKEIKAKFPKAFKLFQGDKDYYWDIATYKDGNSEITLLQMHRDEMVDYKSEAYFDVRSLYDFFDAQKINIVLTIEFDFGWEIYTDRYEQHSQCKKWFNSRSEAEIDAFMKAFCLLEKQTNWKES
jgi:hypothetical protein